MTPRSYQKIIDQADELSRRFEDGFEPSETPAVAALRAAAFRRARAGAEHVEAVKEAIFAGEPRKAIGAAVGTTGEAARQRCSALSALKGARTPTA